MKPYYRVYSNESTAAEHADTLQAAQARAEELAAKHPGRCFEILRCVGYASTSKASTFWMNGEGPPEKPRYRMVDKGEVIESGDEYDDDGIWRPRALTIGEKVNSDHRPTRRPL